MNGRGISKRTRESRKRRLISITAVRTPIAKACPGLFGIGQKLSVSLLVCDAQRPDFSPAQPGAYFHPPALIDKAASSPETRLAQASRQLERPRSFHASRFTVPWERSGERCMGKGRVPTAQGRRVRRAIFQHPAIGSRPVPDRLPRRRRWRAQAARAGGPPTSEREFAPGLPAQPGN